MISAVFSLAFLAMVLHVAVPYALAALGGAITERAGVVDLALESKLLFGAFTAASVGHATGSAYLGLIAGIVAGAAVAAVQIWLALRLEADQVIIGIALNVIALSGTRFLLQLLYHQSANSPETPGFGASPATSPTFWIAVLATAGVTIALVRTRWGLRLRAAGDRPDALVAVGVSPFGARLAAGLVGGALAGAGGAHMSLAVNVFVADMSGGRGYVALAMVILAGWRPALAALACVGIAITHALGIQLQLANTWFPRELGPMLPYLVTLAVLVIYGSSGRPPRALGKL